MTRVVFGDGEQDFVFVVTANARSTKFLGEGNYTGRVGAWTSVSYTCKSRIYAQISTFRDDVACENEVVCLVVEFDFA